MKASAFRRWPVAGAYSPEQTTRLTGGSDFVVSSVGSIIFINDDVALCAPTIPALLRFSFSFLLRNRPRFALFRFLPAFALSRLSSLRAHAGACHQVLSPFANRFATGIGTYGTVKQNPRLQMQTGTNVRGTTLIPEFLSGSLYA